MVDPVFLQSSVLQTIWRVSMILPRPAISPMELLECAVYQEKLHVRFYSFYSTMSTETTKQLQMIFKLT